MFLFILVSYLSANKLPVEYSFYFSNSKTGAYSYTSLQDTVDTLSCKIPFNLIKEYCHREPDITATAGSRYGGTTTQIQNIEHKEARAAEDNKRKSVNFNSLNLNGQKTFGISIGSNRNMSFDQSMELRLNNTFSNDLRVDGVLRDDNLPIQPDGSTQELKEMDEVYINIKKDKNYLRFGDFECAFNNSKFGTLNRQLEGICGGVDTTTLLSGGISKGKWARKEIEGVMGKQGPYKLSQYTIYAGSENVKVNGRPAHRGKEYTIDYADGSIVFTSLLPVEDGDKIIVTFQEMKDEYKTTVFSGSRQINNCNVMVFKEEDMKGTLNSEQIQQFKTANKDSNYIWISGAVFKGAGKGSYIKTVGGADPCVCPNDSIYEYVGFNKGSYEVSFTKIDGGDYEFDGILGGYRYVGAGAGDYISMIRLPIPQKNIFVDANYKKEFNGVNFEFEGGVTRFERNAFQEDVNLGKAFRGTIETQKKHWNAGVNFRQLDSVFYFPGTADTNNLIQNEAFGGITPVDFLGLESRFIRTKADLGSQIGVNFTPVDFPNIFYKLFNSKLRKIDEFLISYNVLGVEPFYNYRNEENVEELIEVGVQNKVFTLSTGEKRKKFVGADSICNNEVSYTNKISISKQPIDLSYIYKQKYQDGNKYVVDLGDFKFDSRGLNLAYNLTSLEQGVLREEFYEVASGRGNFSRDSTGMYYPDPHGNYEKKLVLESNSYKINKDFSFLNSFTFKPISGVSVKLGTLKRGNGEKIRFWERADNSFDDRNQINTGIMTDKLYISYVKKDYRENKIEGMRGTGREGIFEANVRQGDLELKYTTRETKRWTQARTIWDEKANTVGSGISQKFNDRSSLHLMVEGEERLIEKYKFYGYSCEPKVNYEINNKAFEIGTKLTHWLSDEGMPLNIRAIYPTGTTLDWFINFTILSGERTEYIIGYQGNKTPNYPIDHNLNAQLQINF